MTVTSVEGWMWVQYGCPHRPCYPGSQGGGGAFLTDDAAYCLQELRHRELRNLLSCSGVGSTGAVSGGGLLRAWLAGDVGGLAAAWLPAVGGGGAR